MGPPNRFAMRATKPGFSSSILAYLKSLRSWLVSVGIMGGSSIANWESSISQFSSRLAFDPLGFRRESAEVVTDFQQSVGDQLIWYRTAIVKPKRKQNLEAPAGNAHRLLTLEL